MRYAVAAFTLILGLDSGNLYAACTDGTQPGGAKYRICLPSGTWNKQLVVYAHGYVAADQPIAIPEDQLILNGVSIPDTFTSFGYAFAVSSYRVNGLAVLQGQSDLIELTAIFARQFGKPDKIFLGGVSEGGLIATLLAETSPSLYNGSIAACGPIGSFTGQVNYIGDSRNLFDYFFPGVLPGTVISVPPQLWTNWETVYVPAIKAALASNPVQRQSFLNTSQIPTAADPSVTDQNIVDALSYSALTTNDAIAKLRGQPYDNRTRFYFGSTNDFELNSRIPRYTADPSAVQAMKHYETSGKPQIPLVTLHTIADPIVPWAHELGYFFKVLANGNLGNLVQIPVFSNGHCNFQTSDVVFAFIVMLAETSGRSANTVMMEMPEDKRRLIPAEVRNRLALQ
jgi:pimeloyl-ACP methyl ester carboxylesterase